jgi:hypothetical protein
MILEADLSRQATVIEAQTAWLAEFAETMWQFHMVAQRVSFYAVTGPAERYHEACDAYMADSWERVRQLRTAIGVASWFTSEEAHTALREWYEGPFMRRDLEIRSMMERSQGDDDAADSGDDDEDDEAEANGDEEDDEAEANGDEEDDEAVPEDDEEDDDEEEDIRYEWVLLHNRGHYDSANINYRLLRFLANDFGLSAHLSASDRKAAAPGALTAAPPFSTPVDAPPSGRD